MKMRMLSVLGVASLGLTGQVQSQEKAPAGNTPATAAPSNTVAAAGKAQKSETFRVIGYLEKRDRVITIKSGPKGPVYCVAAKDGKVLFENISAQELRAKAPELYEFIKTGVARDASRRFGGLDARN